MRLYTSTKSSVGVENQSKLANIFLALSVLVFLFSGWAWWHYVRSSPERTFYGMIENSLKTRGMTREISQTSQGQSLNQAVQLSLTPQRVAHGYTQITQEGTINASVQTENISTPSADFVRYTKIDTNQKGADSKNLDFAGLLNIWGKTDFSGSTQNAGELYSESILGVVPVGNLNGADRRELMKLITEKDVYQFADEVKKETKDGRPVYTYDVTVAPESYVTMLKEFASSMGMTQLEAVDPANYKDSEPLTFKLTVDVWGRQLVGIEYDGAGRSEVLSGHGITRNVTLPTEAITVEALQAKLQAVQQ